MTRGKPSQIARYLTIGNKRLEIIDSLTGNTGASPFTIYRQEQLMQHPRSIVHIALDNNRDIAAQVSLLLSCFKLIEVYMFVVFERLSEKGRDESRAILGSVNGFSHRMNILRRLADSATDTNVDKGLTSEILDRVEECDRIRNKYAHSIYSQSEVTNQEEWRIGSWFGDIRRASLLEYVSLESIRNERNLLRQTIRDLNYFGNLISTGPAGAGS